MKAIPISKTAFGLQPGNDQAVDFFAKAEPGQDLWLKPLSSEATRSAKQHRLYWLWITEIGKHRKQVKDDIHEESKERYCLPIQVRDDDGIAEVFAAIQAVPGELGQWLRRTTIRQFISTTALSVVQFSEMLGEIEVDAAQRGIRLTHPVDLYMDALMRDLEAA